MTELVGFVNHGRHEDIRTGLLFSDLTYACIKQVKNYYGSSEKGDSSQRYRALQKKVKIFRINHELHLYSNFAYDDITNPTMVSHLVVVVAGGALHQ